MRFSSINKKSLPETWIQSKAITTTQLYSLHNLYHNSQHKMAKIFSKAIIDNYGMMETLVYNQEVLKIQRNNILYNKFMLPILDIIDEGANLVIVTPVYQMRLDQYVQKKGGLNEEQIMIISEQLIKSIYGLIISGYFHCSLRAEHFVLQQGIWKLQSLVYDSSQNIRSCYSWSNSHKPPQAYIDDIDDEAQEQLAEKIVWNFGSIVLHMALGHHKLNKISQLKKFLNSSFSFAAIKAKIGKQFSSQIKQILGKMLHYNKSKRMKLQELFQSGFFSKQIVQHYKKHKNSQQSKNTIQFPQRQKKISQNIQPNKNRQNTIQQNRSLLTITSQSIIHIENSQNSQNKIKILASAHEKIIKATSILKYKEPIQFITQLVKYAIQFARLFELDKIQSETLSQQKQKQVVRRTLDSIRTKIKEMDHQQDMKTNVYSFVFKANFSKSQFKDFSDAYRQIIKIPYSLVTHHYMNNKNRRWASLGLYFTYCMLIDKLYEKGEFEDNFKLYFQWKKDGQDYVTAQGFQQYLLKAPKKIIVQNSRLWIQKYYNIPNQ